MAWASETMSRTQVERYHDICAGHRVVGHEGKCRHFHGHNYRVHFVCESDGLDALGRVIDFSVIKATLCEFLEAQWDHRMLLWEQDPKLGAMQAIDSTVVVLPFNPTAENLAAHLLHEVGPQLLSGTGVTLSRVRIDETRKCSASVQL